MEELRIVAVNGMLGYGYEFSSLDNGVAQAPDLMGVDAGSTDPGSLDRILGPSQPIRRRYRHRIEGPKLQVVRN